MTNTREFVDSVYAGRTGRTRHGFTLVYVDGTILSFVSWGTDALVIVDLVETSGVVSTRHRETFVEI